MRTENLVNEDKQSLEENLKILRQVVDAFHPVTIVYDCIAVGIVVFAIIMIYAYLHRLVAFIALLVGAAIVGKLGNDIICVRFGGLEDQELSKKAVIIMEACINMMEKSDDPIRISDVKRYGNIHIYNKFISYFPGEESFKLKMLSKMSWSTF